jgi:hypothetical protein
MLTAYKNIKIIVNSSWSKIADEVYFFKKRALTLFISHLVDMCYIHHSLSRTNLTLLIQRTKTDYTNKRNNTIRAIALS